MHLASDRQCPVEQAPLDPRRLGEAGQVALHGRITSYNVCYKKLSRIYIGTCFIGDLIFEFQQLQF